MLLRMLAELVAPNACAACDEPIAPNVLFCVSCARTVDKSTLAGDDPPFVGAFVYGGAIAEAIRRFKFQGRPDLVARFAPILAPLVPVGVDLVVPVPIHPSRLAERGYNQSTLLARPVAQLAGLPFAARAVERVRDTPKQSGLAKAERTTNLVRAFAVRDSDVLRGRHVLLVDDVRTTGSTLRACAETLHEVGVRAVSTLVLACSDGSAL